MGHYSELSAESAQQQYGMYLMRGESFTRCFALVRDKMLFTDRRIVFIDHQWHDWRQGGGRVHRPQKHRRGAPWTAGMGFDHAELSFAYITSPYYKVQGVQTETKTLEFPKGFDIRGLYSLLSGSHTRTCAASTHRKRRSPTGS